MLFIGTKGTANKQTNGSQQHPGWIFDPKSVYLEILGKKLPSVRFSRQIFALKNDDSSVSHERTSYLHKTAVCDHEKSNAAETRLCDMPLRILCSASFARNCINFELT